MRVLVTCADPGIPLYGPSGASAHLRGVTRAFAELGWDVRVAAARDVDHRGRWDEPVGVPAFHSRPEHLVGTALAGGWRPDLVWERHTLNELGRVDAPRYVELNAPLALEQRRGRLTAWRERRRLRAADRVVAVSAWLARWAEDAGCADVRHVPNGVEPRPVVPSTGARHVLGFVGTCKPWHGVDRLGPLLDALGPDWTGLVVGDGPSPPPPHPRLERVGTVQPAEIPALLARVTVGVAPYRISAPPWFCPLKVLEYRAAGLPIVATDVGDCRALVGDAGEVLATDDVGAWADAIRRKAVRRPEPSVRTWATSLTEALSGG